VTTRRTLYTALDRALTAQHDAQGDLLEGGALWRACLLATMAQAVLDDYVAPAHHAPPRFPLHIFAVDGETVLGREWPLTRPYHA